MEISSRFLTFSHSISISISIAAIAIPTLVLNLGLGLGSFLCVAIVVLLPSWLTPAADSLELVGLLALVVSSRLAEVRGFVLALL